MSIITLIFEKAKEDGLFYLTEGTSVDGYEVIDGKLYNSRGEYSGKIINMNQQENTMEIKLEIAGWLLQADE